LESKTEVQVGGEFQIGALIADIALEHGGTASLRQTKISSASLASRTRLCTRCLEGNDFRRFGIAAHGLRCSRELADASAKKR